MSDFLAPPAAAVIYEDPDVCIYVAEQPIVRGHCTVTWKHAESSLNNLTNKQYKHLMRHLNLAREALIGTLGTTKDIYLLYEDKAKRISWHLIPRHDSQGLNIYLHNPSKRYDTEIATAIRRNWGLPAHQANTIRKAKPKRKIYSVLPLAALLLIVGLLSFSQYRANSLLKDGVQLDNIRQYSKSIGVLGQGQSYLSLPSTNQALSTELAKTGRWQSDELNMNTANTLINAGHPQQAIYLLEAVSDDYPDYGLAQAKIEKLAKQLPAAPSTFTNPQLVASSDYCQVDATRAPDLMGLADRLASTCQTVFPKIENILHPTTYIPPTHVYLLNFDGPSYEESGDVYLNIDYFRANPNDVGILVHELTHVVQNYPVGPEWVSEGLADYVRFDLGYATADYGLGCDQYSNYTSGYNCSATFINYVQKNYDQNIVKDLDLDMSNGQYSDNLFLDKTGLPLSQLYTNCLKADCKGGQNT